jgi:hypothetical protein
VLGRFIPAALIAVGAIALLAAVLVTRAEAAPHERSCDGKSATFHADRARALIRHAYREERWEDAQPARGRERRAWQEHKRCVRDAGLRESIEDYRERKAEAFALYRRYRVAAPYPGPGGTWWAVPFYVVSCESYGGSWTASNGSHVGPYQLAWNWGPPWPVTSFADQVRHHEIAHHLWTTYGSGQWACA